MNENNLKSASFLQPNFFPTDFEIVEGQAKLHSPISALIGGFLPTGLLGKSWVLCLDWKISMLPNFLNDDYSISLYALNSVIYMAP